MSKLSRTLLFFVVIAGALAISGCFSNSAKSRITSDYVSTVKTVGVVSLLAPTVNVSYLGPSAQESQFAELELESWNTDKLAIEVLLPRLQRKGFTARPIARNDTMDKARASDWRSPLSDSIAEAAYELGDAHGVDVVVVVQSNVDEDFVTETNQKVRGFGIQRAFDTGPHLYATVFVEAYDIKKRFAVGRASGRLTEVADDSMWLPSLLEDGAAQDVATSAQGAALLEQLDKILRIAIGVATQESGL